MTTDTDQPTTSRAPLGDAARVARAVRDLAQRDAARARGRENFTANEAKGTGALQAYFPSYDPPAVWVVSVPDGQYENRTAEVDFTVDGINFRAYATVEHWLARLAVIRTCSRCRNEVADKLEFAQYEAKGPLRERAHLQRLGDILGREPHDPRYSHCPSDQPVEPEPAPTPVQRVCTDAEGRLLDALYEFANVPHEHDPYLPPHDH